MSKNKAGGDTPRSRKKARIERPVEERDESDISDTDKFSDDEEGGIRIDDIYIPPAPPPVCSYESTGPRLIITHIVNENFKSYAGRVLIGPFDKSFSSIVGPNGSGKSNVIDSMLFVFGYRATKIRSKKVSVLIHKSEQHRNVTSCKVEVHFAQITDKPNGDYEKVPNSEFVISRTAFQNSSSFYELNNKRVQFKEVALTLRKHGIDLVHNRFLILQGEVEQIALMKPKAQNPHETGMLEYLEDIIGTTRYKEPIEKLQARIETLNEERQEKLNRLKVVESEREALKGPMEETVNFLKTENRITHLKNKKYQLSLHMINKATTEIQKQKEILDQELVNLNDKLKEIQEQRGSEKTEMDSLNTLLQSIKKKCEQFDEIYQNAEKKHTGLTEELKLLKKNRKKTAENLKNEEEKLKNLLTIPEKNQQQIVALTTEETELNERRQEEEAVFQAVISNLQKETKTFQEEKDKLQAEQMTLKKKYDDMKSAYELAKSERDIYVSSEQTEKTKLAQLIEKLNEIKETLEARKKNLSEIQKELPQKEKTVQKAEENLRTIKTKETAVIKDLRNYQSQLEEKKCSMSANRSRSRVLDYLMQLKREGKIPGILGRLGDLGGIDQKYDIAISTACFQLDYILVDHADTVELCLKALKADNVGRASFLALNRVERYYSPRNAQFKAPSNSSRLFDLIRVEDERVRPAFYFALRDTLVTDNLEQASRIAYGATRHRVVTLNGELIEISGTMSGGGKQVMRGKMGSSASVLTDSGSSEEMNNLERRVNTLEEQLQQFREQERECEEVISRLGPEIKNMKMNVNKLTIEIQGLSKQEPELQIQVKNQEKKVKECALNEKRLNELNKKVEVTEKVAQKAEKEASTIEEKVNVVHEKIMQITEGKTKQAQDKLNDVTKKWEKTRNTITQLQVAIKTSERNAKKAEERIANMKVELEEAEKRETDIKQELETVKNDGRMAVDKADKLKEEIEEKETRLNELKAEHKKFMTEVNALKAAKLKEEQKIEDIEKQINDKIKEVPIIRQKLEKLKLHKIPEFREPVEDEEDEGEKSEKPADEESNILITYDVEVLEGTNSSDINGQLQKEEEYLKTLTPNLNTLKDYEKKTQQYIERSSELREITERRNLCRQGYEEARKNRLQEFMSSFNIISNKLKELYQMLTMGGDAELDLHDSLDPFAEGINFCVRPPKKSWKNITNLSGGEKTLSSLALVFALHYYRPTPLYVMDEIDAALDFKNVSIVGYYIKERTKNAQFIVISLRTNMFELANMLTGIYKTYNCTKTVTIRPDDFCKNEVMPAYKLNEEPMQPPSKVQVLEERRRKSKRFSAELNEQKEVESDNTDLSEIDRDPDESQVLREIQSRERNKIRAVRTMNNRDPDLSVDNDSEVLEETQHEGNPNVQPVDTPSESEVDLSAIDKDSNESELLREINSRRNRTPTRKKKDARQTNNVEDNETDVSTIDCENESETDRDKKKNARKEIPKKSTNRQSSSSSSESDKENKIDNESDSSNIDQDSKSIESEVLREVERTERELRRRKTSLQ